MTVINVQPLFLKDTIVDIEGDDYATAVSSVAFTPTSATTTFTGLKTGATFTDVGATTWTVALTFVQDWDTEESLSRYLFENAGRTVEMKFTPKVPKAVPGTGITPKPGPAFAAFVVIQPGAIGGAVGAATTATVTLGVSGAPALLPAA